MIIKRSTYNEMLDLINQQRHQIEDLGEIVLTSGHKIEKLTRENQTLRNDKRLLLNVLKGDPFDIDYPDTKGGNVVNTHLDSIDHTSTYPIQRHNDGTQFFRF